MKIVIRFWNNIRDFFYKKIEKKVDFAIFAKKKL